MSSELSRVLNNRPVNIQNPQHPCYPVASVVGHHGSGTEIALHKSHHGAVLTSLGGELVKEILFQCRIENWQDGAVNGQTRFCSHPLEMLLKYEQFKELGIDVAHILAMLQYAEDLQEDQEYLKQKEEVEVKLNLEE
jgi:hypothetical protein